MLKNPNKRKVNATKVTRMTWIPKDSAHGSRGGLMKLKSDTTSMSTSHSTSASPCKDPANNSNVSTLIKQIGSTPQLLFQGSFEPLDFGFSPIKPMWIPHTKTYNDYLQEWLNYKEEFLECLLQMEAPPNPRECSNCRIEGTYTCSDCFSWPMFCTACCQNEHQRLPFHWIEQWTGSFFEESSLTLQISYKLYLGHNGHPCLEANSNDKCSGSENHNEPMQGHVHSTNLDDEQAWMDIDAIPFDYLILVDTSGVHFITVRYCSCSGVPDHYLQLLCASLYLTTILRPRMVFSFRVLNDFIRDNLECGTSSMNYYSNLQQITSNVFPHVIPQGELVLFCPACPQSRINLDQNEVEHQSCKFTRSFIMDVRLMDGLGYMVGRENYKAYLKATHHPLKASTCNNHQAVNQANTGHRKLEATSIRATACTWHGCFVPHTIVDFQKGERQVNMDYSLAHALGHNMDGITDLNIIPRIGIWHVHGHRPECYARYALLFISGVGWVDSKVLETLWSLLNIVSGSTRGMTSSHCQELLDFQMNDSNFMKMIRMRRSVHAMELDLLQCPPTSADRQTGAPTWLSRGLKIQEAQIILARDMQCVGLHATEIQHLAIARRADRLSTDISGFLSECKIHLGTTSEDKMPSDDSEVESDANAGDANEDLLHRFEGRCPDRAHIALPSTLELNHLMEMELQLRIGQADEVLQEIWVGVANKAIIYCGDLQPVTGYAKKTRGWAKVHAVQHVLDKHALAMVWLSADEATLAQYQILWKEQLNVNTGLQYEVLPWYFNLDIKSERTSSAWMSEFIQVHWLQAKATKDWWLEEEELLKCEFEWSISCFQHCMKRWKNRRIESQQIEFTSAACYAVRQEVTYEHLPPHRQ
ncbi:hypothetical protein V8E55_002685 [Tylopilus felleus]